MKQIDDGGPAFPRSWSESFGGEIYGNCTDGMSLREWFAGQALASGKTYLEALDEADRLIAALKEPKP